MNLYDKAAEDSILGSVLIDNSKMSDVSALEPGDFYSMANGSVFRTMKEMYIKGRRIDFTTLAHEMALAGSLMVVGGQEYITGLADKVVSHEGVGHYADIVKRLSVSRAVRRSFLEGVELIDNGVGSEDVVSLVQGVADKAAAELMPRDDSGAEEEAKDFLAEVQSGVRDATVKTGFAELDVFAPGVDEMTIIAARPSTGKTALAVALAEKMAMDGKRVVLFSIEMSVRSIMWRRWASLAGVDLSKMRRPDGLNKDELGRIAKASKETKSNGFTVLDSVVSIGQIVMETKRMHSSAGLDAVFIDHLLLMKIPESDRRDLQLGYATGVLKRMCTRLGLPVFLLTQLRRASEDRKNGRPMLSDLRDSGIIEQDADVVWLPHRPDRFDKNPSEEMEVIAAKNRNGPIGSATIGYKPSTGEFFEQRAPF